MAGTAPCLHQCAGDVYSFKRKTVKKTVNGGGGGMSSKDHYSIPQVVGDG